MLLKQQCLQRYTLFPSSYLSSMCIRRASAEDAGGAAEYFGSIPPDRYLNGVGSVVLQVILISGQICVVTDGVLQLRFRGGTASNVHGCQKHISSGIAESF
ncbi:hypothetical protein Trydic_g4014 [Trypoxylus dichotomus]